MRCRVEFNPRGHFAAIHFAHRDISRQKVYETILEGVPWACQNARATRRILNAVARALVTASANSQNVLIGCHSGIHNRGRLVTVPAVPIVTVRVTVGTVISVRIAPDPPPRKAGLVEEDDIIIESVMTVTKTASTETTAKTVTPKAAAVETAAPEHVSASH